MGGLLVSGAIDALPDHPTPSTTFYTPGADRIDVTAYGFDVRLEILTPSGGWEDPQRVAGGLHRGFTGLALQYKGGALGFRLSAYTPGKNGSCDFEAAAVA